MKRPLLCLLLLALPLPALAQVSVRDTAHARSIGMGGAYRALGLGADALLGNPASMSLLKAYQIELTGAYDFAARDGYGILALRDSSTSDLAAGLNYQFLAMGTPAARRFGHLATLGISFPIGNALIIGASGKYFNQSGAARANAGTMDVGLAVRPGGGLVIGLGAHNVVDTTQPELARFFTGSLAYLGSSFNVALDVRSTLRGDTGAPMLNLGGEYMFGQSFLARLGYAHDFFTSQNFGSIGVGFFGEGGGVDLAYRHEFGNLDGRLLTLTARLQM
jgi:hypothetical protein